MMKSVIAFWKSINPEITPSAFLAYHIGSSFYDCMSGGMPKYELFICRSLLQDSRIDLQTQVYPAGKEFIEKTGRDWYTLQDFLSETASDQSFQFEYNQLHGSLPLLPETT